MKYIKAKKIKMGQIFRDDAVIPVTFVEVMEQPEDIMVKEGDLLKVAGTMKGRGFQGVVKRHGFHGGPKTHGQKNRHRAPGSIGSVFPQRVIKGHKMAGHMGCTRVTVKNLKLVEIGGEDRKILSIEGAVPGFNGSFVEIRLA
jgi:large subunit ribosomal protein L3